MDFKESFSMELILLGVLKKFAKIFFSTWTLDIVADLINGFEMAQPMKNIFQPIYIQS